MSTTDDDLEIDGPDAPVGDEAAQAVERVVRRGSLRDGIREVRALVERARLDYSVQCLDRERRGIDPPEANLPRTSSDDWVDRAAACLRDFGVPDWFPHDDLEALGEDPVGRPLDELRSLPECATFYGERIHLRWTRKAILRKDYRGDDVWSAEQNEPRCGRVKPVQKAERLTWSGGGRPPSFRFELSLPWFLLAEDDEVEHGLHDLLQFCGMKDGEPKLHKPDIVAHSATLARFGVRHLREAQAVAQAQRHPQHRALLLAHGIDPATGRGLAGWKDMETHRRQATTLFPEKVLSSAEMRAMRERRARERSGKDAAAEPREPGFTADPDEEMEH